MLVRIHPSTRTSTAGRITMNVKTSTAMRSAVLLLSAALLASGCTRTKRETVLSSDTLKVVAVTESRLDINVSKYQHLSLIHI